MKVEPGAEFLVNGIKYTIVEKSNIGGLWMICQTFNPVANLKLVTEEWIKYHAHHHKRSPKQDETQGD